MSATSNGTPGGPRIAIVCPLQFGAHCHVGGGTRYPLELARAMAKSSECDLVVFDIDRGEVVDEHGLRHRLVRDRGRRSHTVDPWSTTLLGILRDYDVVHFHTVNRMALAGGLVSRLAGKTVLLTPLGGGARTGIGKYGLYRVFSGFPVISEYTSVPCAWVRRRPHAVIYGGGDAAGFGEVVPVPGEQRQERVVYAGRITAHKGVDVLIEAVPPGAELILCGQVLDDEYAGYLRRLARGKPVEFVSPLDDLRLSELYGTASAVVLPSVQRDFRGTQYPHPELLGLVLLEAMWHGTAVVASAVGGIPEIVQDGHGGFLVPPGNANVLRDRLERLLEDRGLRTRMGAAGRQAAEEKFTWSQTAARSFAFYGTLGRGRASDPKLQARTPIGRVRRTER